MTACPEYDVGDCFLTHIRHHCGTVLWEISEVYEDGTLGDVLWPRSTTGKKMPFPLDYVEEITPTDIDRLGWSRMKSEHT